MATYLQSSHHNFNNNQVEDMILILRSILKQNEEEKSKKHILNFECYENIQDSLFESWIGYNKNQFLTIFSTITLQDCG